MLFTLKQVGLPKLGLILQKSENRPKTNICPFCTKAFNYYTYLLEMDFTPKSKRRESLSFLLNNLHVDCGYRIKNVGLSQLSLFDLTPFLITK